MSRIFHQRTRPHLDELELSRTLELAAAVLDDGDEPILRSPRGSRVVPEPTPLGCRGVLGEREAHLSAVQRLALVDAVASGLIWRAGSPLSWGSPLVPAMSSVLSFSTNLANSVAIRGTRPGSRRPPAHLPWCSPHQSGTRHLYARSPWNSPGQPGTDRCRRVVALGTERRRGICLRTARCELCGGDHYGTRLPRPDHSIRRTRR